MHSISNTRIRVEGDRAAVQSQWSVIHRLRHEQGFADFWHQGRYLDVFEERDAEWKILHRVVVADFDRWIETLDLRGDVLGSSENTPLVGCRGTEDAGYLGFDLVRHRPERPAMDDLWGGLVALSAAFRKA